MKVITVLGTRPEIIKMSALISKMDEISEHILCHTGQNYDYTLNKVFFDDLNVRQPDYYLDAAGITALETISKVLYKIESIIQEEKPDAALIYGDTNSCLCSIAFKKYKIPIFHMEAGNRCFDQRVPEEVNRKIVDHTSDINIVLSEHARRNLISEGFPSNYIFKTGSAMREVLSLHTESIKNSKALHSLDLSPKSYIIASIHREENVDSPVILGNILLGLSKISRQFNLPIILSTHPRTRKRIELLPKENVPDSIRYMEPFGFIDYISLQINAALVISDSGTITEETDILGLKSIMLRQSHERPEGADVGSCPMTGTSPDDIFTVANLVLLNKLNNSKSMISDYTSNRFSEVVASLVLSYTQQVNREIWKK